MNAQEIAELNAWIHKHVFELDLYRGVKRRGLWYRPGGHGYTDSQAEAWKMTQAEAKQQEHLNDAEPVTIHEFQPMRYDSDPAASRELEEKCVQRVSVRLHQFNPQNKGEYSISAGATPSSPNILVHAETIELAWVKFARQFFAK